MKTIGIYIRVVTSRVLTGGYSLQEQRDKGIAKAHQMFGNNIHIKFYIDEGNAKSISGRAEQTKMMQDVRKGRLHAIITYRVSHFKRNLADSLSVVEEINNFDVAFISIKEGQYGTPHGNFVFNILYSVAQYQRESFNENDYDTADGDNYHNNGKLKGVIK